MKNSGYIFVAVIVVSATLAFWLGTFITKTAEPSSSLSQPTESKVIEAKIVAVDADNKGVSADLITEVRPGTGLVLVNINDVLADLNMQVSARVAAKVAGEYALKNMSRYDVLYRIRTDAEIVGGQSAGSSMAVTTIAALLNLPLRPDVILTGPMLEDGTITEAGAVIQKAEAAKSLNASLFLVPKGGNEGFVGYTRKKDCALIEQGTYCSIRTVEDKANIAEIVGISIQEVEDITDAMRYMTWFT